MKDRVTKINLWLALPLLLLLPGNALAQHEVSGGDGLNFTMRRARQLGLSAIQKATESYLPDTATPEQRTWLLTNGNALGADLAASSLRWITEPRPTCAESTSRPQAEIILAYESCRQQVTSLSVGASFLLQAALRHLGITTEVSLYADLVLQSWHNAGADQARWDIWENPLVPSDFALDSNVQFIAWTGSKLILQARTSDSIAVYDTETRQLSPIAPPTEGLQSLHNFSLVAVGTHLVFYPQNYGSRTALRPISYDLGNRIWSIGSPSDEPISERQQERAFLMAGSKAMACWQLENWHWRCQLYDPSSDRWESIPDLDSTRMDLLNTVSVGKKIVLYGRGWTLPSSGSSPLTAHIYDTESRTWSPVSAENSPDFDAAMWVQWTGSKVMFWSTATCSKKNLRPCMSYDPLFDRWEPIDVSTFPKAFDMQNFSPLQPQIAATDNKVYIWPRGGIYHPPIGGWSSIAQENAPTADMTAIFPVQNGFFFFGVEYSSTTRAYRPVVAVYEAGDVSPVNHFEGTDTSFDALRFRFERGRQSALQIIREMREDFFAESTRPEVKEWILVNRQHLTDDLARSSFDWLLEDQEATTCAATTQTPAAPITLNYQYCKTSIASREAAGALLLHETVHHFGIGSEQFADDVAFSLYESWHRMGGFGAHWQNLSLAGLPANADVKNMVWAGSKLIYYSGTTPSLSRIYDPLSTEWTRLPPPPDFTARSSYSMIWTGKEVLIWGGETRDASGALLPLNTGLRFDMQSRTWSTMPQGDALPRRYHQAFWTGKKMLIWGGTCSNSDSCGERRGEVFDPVTGEWTAIPFGPLPYLEKSTVHWDGHALVILGQPWQQGVWVAASYDPETQVWTDINLEGMPNFVVHEMPAFMTAGPGNLLLSGSIYESGHYSFEGVLLNTDAHTWSSISGTPNASSSDLTRYTIWTGKELFFYFDNKSYRFDLYRKAWLPLESWGVPNRDVKGVFWTGETMLMFATGEGWEFFPTVN